MTEICIIKRSSFIVDCQEVKGCTRLVDNSNTFGLLKPCQVVSFDFDDEVNLTGLKGYGTGRTFGNDPVCQLLYSGSAFPIILKGLEFDAVAQSPLYELIRAGADGVGIKVVAAVKQGLWKYIVGSQVVKGLGVDFLRCDDKGQLIDNLNALPEGRIRAGVGRILPGVFHRGLDILGRHGLAVMELDALS